MNKDKSYRHNLRIELQRKEIIEDIKTEMICNNAQEINLHGGIIFNYIDDQMNEVIGGVTLDERVFIDSGHDMDTISLQDLSTDQLICLLKMIEEKEFEVTELLEE
jgi:hypothetical protein